MGQLLKDIFSIIAIELNLTPMYLICFVIIPIHYCFDSVYFYNRNTITKTRLYNFEPLESHFYIVKLGFTGVCTIFLISAQNIDCGYSLEPRRF